MRIETRDSSLVSAAVQVEAPGQAIFSSTLSG